MRFGVNRNICIFIFLLPVNGERNITMEVKNSIER